jgi:hypothetical protein
LGRNRHHGNKGTVLATFTDPAGAEAIGDYSADIDWGDGDYRPGVISVDGNGTFTVKGSHTYTEEGRYNLVVDLHHDEAADTVVMSTAVISDPAVEAGGGFGVLGHAGQDTGVQPVAYFVDPGSTEPVSSYSADIAWGDGGMSAGTVTYDQGFFTVSGHHTYQHGGTYKITVITHHESAPDAVVFSEGDIDGTGPIGGGSRTVQGDLPDLGIAGRELATQLASAPAPSIKPLGLSANRMILDGTAPLPSGRTRQSAETRALGATGDTLSLVPALGFARMHLTSLDDIFALMLDRSWEDLV